MTPKFKYDPDQHCLREVARVREPIRYMFHLARTYQLARQSYEQHLASLRVIPCYPGSKWPQGELTEGVDFQLRMSRHEMGAPVFAFPITPQPRLYTQAEAEEIFKDAYRMGMTYRMGLGRGIESPLEYEQQQYFKTRFNVEL